MAKLVRCPAGLHQYDAERYSLCPYCNNSTVQMGGSAGSDDVTRPLDRQQGGSEDTTRPYKQSEEKTAFVGKPAASPANDSEKTQIYRAEDSGVQPVTGWLVVTEGPGAGTSLPVFHGVNSIGRSSGEQICLDFSGDSDPEIARTGQARITYDPKGNCFYLQHGDGKNLTYLNDQPVLELRTLSSYDAIGMGKTVMLFVPFCGDRFQWPE